MENKFKKIKDLIAKNELVKAIELLNMLAIEDKHINYLVMQSARYYELEKAIHLNILEWEKVKIEKSQIRLAILNLIDELDAEEKEEQKFIFESDGTKRSFIQGSYKMATRVKYLEDFEIDIPVVFNNLQLEGLVLRFLKVFDKWYFSPLRIKDWGSIQDGFENLKNYSSREITAVLLNLHKQKKVKSTMSKKGNPIYKII